MKNSDKLGRRIRERLGGLSAVVWLSMFGLLTVALLFTFLIRRDRDEINATTADHANEQALVLAEHAARLFEGAELALSIVVDDAATMEWNALAGSQDLWRRVARLSERLPYVDAFWLHDSQGRLALTSLTFPPPVMDASERDFFMVHKVGNGDGAHVGTPMASSDGDATFRLSRRLDNPDGSFRGVASLTIRTGYFRRFYRSLSLPLGSQVVLERKADRVELVRQQVGDQPLPDADHVRASRPIPGFPLLVEVSIPLSALTGEWHHRLMTRLAMASLAVMALSGLTLMGLRQSSRQQRFQEELATRVAARTAELAEANQKLEMLLHEVHHRVNNNLQIIGMLLTLQSARAADPLVRSALANSIGRVDTIGLVHRTLYGSGAAIDLAFGDYVAALAQQIGDLYGQSRMDVRVTGANPRFHIEIAVPLALVVHEVLSNVLRHAFPIGRQGSVSVGLERENDYWLLSIEDDGTGLPAGFDWSASQGLGLEIIRLLSAQLGGVARFASGQRTRFTLRFPHQQ